jgi:hypothetical protein
MEAVAKHQEVPKEEATVETIWALEDQYGDWHLAVGHRRQPKKRNQGNGGSRQKLAAAWGRLTLHTVPAPRMGHCCHDQARTMLYAKPLKVRLSRRDVGRDLNTIMA